MDTSDESLELVFGALDTENKGFITVDQFVSTFCEFYESPNHQDHKVSTSRSDIERLVHLLDPENDGIIHFEDFKKAFQAPNDIPGHSDDLNAQTTLGDGHVFSPSNATNRSTCFSDGLENKTDDSGVHTHEPSIYDCDNDSSLSADGIHSSRLQRDEIRRSWPKHRGTAFPNTNLPESPGSASRSDLLMDDMETNLELMRDQIQRMEERVEGIQNTHHSEKESRIDRLREENARLTAQVTVLEERLKEAEARAERNVEAERTHLQSIISRNTREHNAEVEGLRARISALENECSDLRVESARVKADSQAAVLDLKRNTEALAEAQDQLRMVQEEKQAADQKHQRDMDVLRKDRDHAVQVLEELNGSGERRRSRLGSTCTPMSGGSEALARYQESQEIVRRLIQENKQLRKQLEDAQDEMFAMSLEEGRTLANTSEKTWSKEIDNCTKEEVVELWTREKHANEQLRNYIDSLITRIIERHPSLLEVAATPAR